MFSGKWKTIFYSTLSAYSTVLFSSDKKIGFFVLVGTFLNPYAGVTGLLGVLFSNLIALFIGVNEERVIKGQYGFNGLLVGLSISLYHKIDSHLVLMLFASVVLLVFVTLALEYILSYYFSLPVLSIPFVLVSIIIYMAFYTYKAFQIRENYVFPLDMYFPELPTFVLYYIKNMGGIFFQSSPWAGSLFALLLLLSSRIAFLLSLLGFCVGSLFYLYLQGDVADLGSGVIGFNYILTAIAVGGVFLIPGPYTFILAALASIASALIAAFTKVFLVQFNIPVLALPFTTATLLFLYVSRLLRNMRFIPVDFIPGIPENNLDYYKTRLQRFGYSGLYIRLPFTGKWKVSQGYNGKYTHKDSWKESLDFMAIGPDGKVRKGKEDTVSDYYTFGLPVLAPSAGRVVKVINHLDDNPLFEVDTKNNWGNLVLIEHTGYLYSQISHFQKGSIIVKEGDYVTAGHKLGLAGNSGRSPEPHIHIHFQSTPELGSSTIPISFTQYLEESGDRSIVQFNKIPVEEEILSNLQSDFNAKNFFSLAPGQSFSIKLQKKGSKEIIENWKVNLDLMGNRFLEDEKLNRVYFFSALDYFTCLEYIGNKNTGLFFFYLAFYRIPFIATTSVWEDDMSYKYFSSTYSKFFKDLVQPFSDRVGYKWKGKMESRNLISEVYKNQETKIFSINVNTEQETPGIVKITNLAGEEWEISRIS